MEIMHGLFELKNDVSETAFRRALEALGEHLSDAGLLEAWRLVRREPHPSFDTGTPPRYHLTMEFSGLRQADDAYACIKNGTAPVSPLHRAVFSKVRDAPFAMYRDLS